MDITLFAAAVSFTAGGVACGALIAATIIIWRD